MDSPENSDVEPVLDCLDHSRPASKRTWARQGSLAGDQPAEMNASIMSD